MVFRANEVAEIGYERVKDYLIPRPENANAELRAQSKEEFIKIADELGSVVDAYPVWHPLVCNHDSHHPVTTPSSECGYKGLDHTIFFTNGFISCPYGDGQDILDSVDALPSHHSASITAEKLDNVTFYNPSATPILVKCEWNKRFTFNIYETIPKTIPKELAIPLMLEKELPCWEWAQFAETWDTMRPYFLGKPHGSRSSLFVSQETGQIIKKIWETLIYTGMFGPIKV